MNSKHFSRFSPGVSPLANLLLFNHFSAIVFVLPLARRDVRVAEGARLESVFTRKGNRGSNPRLSASLLLQRTHKGRIWTGMRRPTPGLPRRTAHWGTLEPGPAAYPQRKAPEGRGSVRGFQGSGANGLATGRRKPGRGPAPGTVAALETQRPLGARLLGRAGSNPPLPRETLSREPPSAGFPRRSVVSGGSRSPSAPMFSKRNHAPDRVSSCSSTWP